MKEININFLSYLLIILSVLVGCQTDENAVLNGEGKLNLGIVMDNNLQVVSTRSLASDEAEELMKDCKIRIYDTDKLIRKYLGISDLPAEGIILPSGEYKVRVTAGDSVAASFDQKYYEGIKTFTINKGVTTTVDVTCNIGNTVAKVAYGESLKNVFKDDCAVAIAVKAENGTLNFDMNNVDAMGYFSCPVACDTLFCTFTATDNLGRSFTHVDTVPQVKSATLYQLTYEYKEGEVEMPDTGGGILKLNIDATPLYVIDEEIIYYRRPVFTAYYGEEALNLDGKTTLEQTSGADVKVNVAGSSVLQQVQLVSDKFPEFLGANESSYDLVNLTDAQKTTLSEGGILVNTKEESKGYALEFTLSADLIRKYTANEGTYSISLTAIDANGKMRIANWKIIVSNATVQIESIPVYETWATKATLYGSIVDGREPQGILTFRYRKVDGDNEWKSVNAIREGQSVKSVIITGLTPGTTYEYQLLDGDLQSASSTFTTENAVQLPNSGFEEWSGSVPLYIAPSSNESDIFWDSGNHGSATMKINVTMKDTSVKHTGVSAKLSSTMINAIVVKQFAAGNIFYGRYLDTEMNGFEGNGVLGWGRVFSSRPIAITGWIRYDSGIVDVPKDGYISKGEQDQGYVFIALGDWQGEDFNGTKWPVIIKTKNASQLFDHSRNNKGIIAHGEQTWYSSTEGDGMHRFTIPLDYWYTDRIPTSIIVVASASKFGDYFAGSTKSVMWLDDLSLVYDESELTE